MSLIFQIHKFGGTDMFFWTLQENDKLLQKSSDYWKTEDETRKDIVRFKKLGARVRYAKVESPKQ